MFHPCVSSGILLILLRIAQVPSTYGFSEPNTWTMDLKMPGSTTSQEDAYLFTHFPVPYPHRTSYIVEIIPRPNHSTAHHMMLHGCSQPVLQGVEENIASGSCNTLLYAWAHGAPGLRFPPGVGVPVGQASEIKGFQLDLHYLPKVISPDQSGVTLVFTDQPQPRSAGVFLMLSADAFIPPGRRNFTIDISCRVPKGVQFTLMAMRTHAHSLGRVIMGYRKKEESLKQQLLGQGSPQWPQAFYSLRDLNASFDSIDIESGDILFARCVYDSTSRSRRTVIGSTHNDEMCNLYMMYYANPSFQLPEGEGSCYANEFPEFGQHIKAQTEVPISPPTFEPSAIYGLLGNSNSKPAPKISLPYPLRADSAHLGQLSAVAAVQLSEGQEVLLLHRGERSWDETSPGQRFDQHNRNVFIMQSPVIHMDPVTQEVKMKWGAGHFVLPHGLTVSVKRGTHEPDAVFITDVALHQVFKFAWGQWDKPVWILGTRFESGSSESQFCQPTDVAISSTGDIYVADGFCNSRVMKFSPNGTYLLQWPVKNAYLRQRVYEQDGVIRKPFTEEVHSASNFLHRSLLQETSDDGNLDVAGGIVHSLAIIPSDSSSFEQVCAANRETARILCCTVNGDPVAKYGGLGLLPAVYAIEYSATHNILFAVVRGSTGHPMKENSRGVLINPVRPKSLQLLHNDPDLLEALIQSSAISGFFALPGIEEPHDLAISPDARYLYLVENNRAGLYRFMLEIDTKYSVVSSLDQLPGSALAVTGKWMSSGRTGVILAGSLMLAVVFAFISTLVCIRMCWCGRKSDLPQRRANKSNNSRWSGRPTRAQKVGFRLLNQTNDLSDGINNMDDEEDDCEDVLLQRNQHNGLIPVKVDAESVRLSKEKTLRQVACVADSPTISGIPPGLWNTPKSKANQFLA